MGSGLVRGGENGSNPKAEAATCAGRGSKEGCLGELKVGCVARGWEGGFSSEDL